MSRQAIRRLAVRALGALSALAFLANMANAAELVMFRGPGCPWCAKWDREIGTIYPKTELGRRAPLRMVDLGQGDPAVRTQSPVRYTPTFVLARDGREVGRIEGYPGEEFFWGLLERLLERLPPAGTTGLPVQSFGVYQASAPERSR